MKRNQQGTQEIEPEDVNQAILILTVRMARLKTEMIFMQKDIKRMKELMFPTEKGKG